MRRLMLLGPVTSVLCAVALAGCAGCTTGGPGPGTGDVGAGFAEVLALPAGSADYAWYPESVTEALPSVRYLDGGEAHASDLNPIAVLITKALIEIPPKFCDQPPVFPGLAETRTHWKGAEGLAADVRAYGQWIRDEAEKRTGYFTEGAQYNQVFA